MLNRIKKFINDYGLVLALSFVLSLVVFSKYVFKGATFRLYNDQVYQFNLFYDEWLRLVDDFIRTHELPFYSWNTFLGQDFFANKIYYCIFDFLLPVIYVLNKVLSVKIETCLLVETMMLVVISALTMKRYTKEALNNKTVQDIITIIYAFSGFATVFFANYMWHRFYALLPLLFLGIEIYQKKHKLSLFSIVVALLFLQNYYLMFPTTFFIVGYYIASYLTKKDDAFWNCIKSALPLIASYIVGALLAGIALLPTVYVLMGNERVGAGMGSGLFFELRTIVGVFWNMAIPPFAITGNPVNNFHNEDYYLTYYSNYASILMVLGFVSLLYALKKKETRNYAICYLVYLLIFFVRPLNSIMHALSGVSFRWLFLLDFLLLVIVGRLIEDSDFTKGLLKRLLLFVLVIVIGFVLINLLDDYGRIGYGQVLALGLEVALGYVLILFIKKKQLLIVLILIAAELGIANTYMVYNYSRFYGEYTDTMYQEYVDYFLKRDDNLMTRVYIDPEGLLPSSYMNMNIPMHYNYMSTTTYDTTYEQVLNPFINWNVERYNVNIVPINDIDMLHFLGVRYYGVYDESDLPAYANGYTYAFNINTVLMYELNDYNSLAHSYSSFARRSDFENDRNIDWNGTAVIEDGDYYLVEDIVPSDVKYQLQIMAYTNNHLEGYIENDEKCLLITTIPYSKGWKVFEPEGERYQILNVDGGFLGIIIEPGQHFLYYYYTSPIFKYAVVTTGIGVMMLVAELYLDFKQKN